jgi:hypothetical protein
VLDIQEDRGQRQQPFGGNLVMKADIDNVGMSGGLLPLHGQFRHSDLDGILVEGKGPFH